MAACPSCGADGTLDGPCPSCGATPYATPSAGLPDLELDVPVRKPRKPPAPRQPQAEARIELAVDPRTLDLPGAGDHARGLELDVPVRKAPKPPAARQPQAEPRIELAVDPRSFGHGGPPDEPPPASMRNAAGASAGSHVDHAAPPASMRLAKPAARPLAAGADDVAADARVLAEYGSPPRQWFLSAPYAWRVLQRQRELKLALASRREEAARAAEQAQAALSSFAERVRPVSEKESSYAGAHDELRRAEETLRSRDRVLAAEQGAQAARLAAVDARLVKLEADLAQAQADERALAAETANTESALAREEAKLKRAEAELRAAQKREAAGTDE